MSISRSHLMPSDRARECWLPTLQLAVQEVFDLMLASSLEVCPDAACASGLDVSSMVGLAGQLSGVLTLRCRAQSAALMASRMLGIEPEAAGAQIWDALGEICNMTAGNFKNKISGLGDGCMLSVPTVISGADYNVHSMGNQSIHAGFRFEGEPVVLSLEVRS